MCARATDSQKDLQTALARNERLEAELEDALLKVEVNFAKAAMYDDLNDKFESAQSALAKENDSRAAELAELAFLRKQREELAFDVSGGLGWTVEQVLSASTSKGAPFAVSSFAEVPTACLRDSGSFLWHSQRMWR